jgi:hypothetical protein
MSALYSNRLEKRNFELEFNPRQGPDNFPELGEITGDQFMYNDIDQGMPVRGNFMPNKNDKKTIFDNTVNDFDLFDKKSNLKINYFDPQNDNYNSGIAKLDNMTNKSIINDMDKMANNIDEYGYLLFNNVQKYLLKNHYLLASYNLTNILTSLYIGSKNKTLLELKNYLNLSEKQKCMNDLNMFYNEINQLRYCSLINFLIVPYDFKINKTLLNYLDCIKVLNYEGKYSDLNKECLQINKYISNSHKDDFLNTIKPHHLKDDSILGLISGKIEPIWKNNFDEIVKDTFLSFKKREQNFLIARNKNYNYCKYDSMELIELQTYDNKMSFGIILSNDDYFPNITSELMNYMIDNLAPTKFKYLMLPQINENIKMKYGSILKETGLVRIFNSLEIPELITNNNICLNDILQNIHLVINKNNTNTTNSEKVSSTYAKKINTPFMYYLRINTINTILCMGQYS